LYVPRHDFPSLILPFHTRAFSSFRRCRFSPPQRHACCHCQHADADIVFFDKYAATLIFCCRCFDLYYIS